MLKIGFQQHKHHLQRANSFLGKISVNKSDRVKIQSETVHISIDMCRGGQKKGTTVNIFCLAAPWFGVHPAVLDDLIKTDGIMNSEKHSQILPSRKHPISNSFIFQHDNNNKNTAKMLKAHLDRKNT